jgi:hypothetical protein
VAQLPVVMKAASDAAIPFRRLIGFTTFLEMQTSRRAERDKSLHVIANNARRKNAVFPAISVQSGAWRTVCAIDRTKF